MTQSRRSYWKRMVLGVAAITLAPISAAWPADVCVNNAVDLDLALKTAEGNGQDDIIRIVQGVYVPPDPYIWFEATNAGEAFSISILGGYTAGCTSRTLYASNTVLQGSDKKGGLFIASAGDVLIEGITIQDTSYGMALRVQTPLTPAAVTVRNSHILNNVSPGAAAGVDIHQASVVTLTDNVIDGNSGSYTGGVYINWGTDDVTLTGNTISHNSDLDQYAYGGVFIATAGNVTLTSNQVIQNTGGLTGGLHLHSQNSDYNTSLKLVNNVVVANTGSGPYDSGGLHIDSFHYVTLANNTITENNAPACGGVEIEPVGVGDAPAVDIYNNIIQGNVATEGTAADLCIPYNWLGVASVTLSHNDFDKSASGFLIEGPYSDDNNIDNIDPEFVDAASFDYHLTSTSPVIDAGDNGAPALPEFDLDGNERIVDGDGDLLEVVDMGAYEYDRMSCSAYLDKRSCQSDAGCVWQGNPHNGYCEEAPLPVDCSAYDGDRAACRAQPSCRWSPRDSLCLTR